MKSIRSEREMKEENSTERVEGHCGVSDRTLMTRIIMICYDEHIMAQ